MQSLAGAGQAIGSGASTLGNYALQGAQNAGNFLFGQGQNPGGNFMGPLQQQSPLSRIAPYFSDFLQGQGIGGNLLGGMGAPEGGFDTGLFGDLLRSGGNGRQALMQQLPGFANPMQGLLGGVVGPGARFVPGQEATPARPQPGIVRGIISGYTGGILGGHTGT